MVEDAEKYGVQDRERKAAIEAANRADSVLNDTEKALKEYEDRLDKAEADQIREKISSLREFAAKNQSGEGTATAEELKQKVDELQNASLTLFDKMHKARAEESQQSSQPGQTGDAAQGSEGEKKPWTVGQPVLLSNASLYHSPLYLFPIDFSISILPLFVLCITIIMICTDYLIHHFSPRRSVQSVGTAFA